MKKTEQEEARREALSKGPDPILSLIDYILEISPVIICFIIGPGLLGYIMFDWLKTGIWNSYSLLDVINFILKEPPDLQLENWKGVEKILIGIGNILSGIPVWLVGFVLFIGSVSVVSSHK